MRTEVLKESRTSLLDLTEDQAKGLIALGKQLSSSKAWWGGADEPEDRTIIRCKRESGSSWCVRVIDAIGAVGLGDLQLIVEPKIPPDHFWFLADRSGHLPRIDLQRTALAHNDSMHELMAQWLTTVVERLVRADLVRDYRPVREMLGAVRGRVDPLSTASGFYVGRLAVDCEFDEFDIDNPLNRVIRAATRTVARTPSLSKEVRKRARRLVLRLDGIGDLQPGDTLVPTDRRTGYYGDAITLARAVLAGAARGLASGEERAWTFLFRTPELVEDGLRAHLVDRLGPACKVTKKAKAIEGTHMTLNPDLIFNDVAIADVKYKVGEPAWRRPDLYQIVTFAEGFGFGRAAMIDFGSDPMLLPSLTIGSKRVSHLQWHASKDVDPASSLDDLVGQVGRWLAAAAGAVALT